MWLKTYVKHTCNAVKHTLKPILIIIIIKIIMMIIIIILTGGFFWIVKVSHVDSVF